MFLTISALARTISDLGIKLRSSLWSSVQLILHDLQRV